jgi:PPOX class probable F420-dependent enzyme
MSTQILDSHKDLLTGPVPVTLATVMPDGQPQLTVVWCTYDGTHILVSTARGRMKEKNMRARPMATLMAVDTANPFRYLEVRGRVEITQDGAMDLINQLAMLYMGQPKYYGGVAPADLEAQEERVICKILPQRVHAFG